MTSSAPCPAWASLALSPPYKADFAALHPGYKLRRHDLAEALETRRSGYEAIGLIGRHRLQAIPFPLLDDGAVKI